MSKRKMTRKEKIKLTEKNICWKCGNKLNKDKKTIKCTNCNNELTIV